MRMKTGINLLICDDDPVDRKLVKAYLHKDPWYDFNIIEADEPDEIAIALANEKLDLIILDFQLPGKTGLEWLQEIEERKIAPAIILTGFGSELLAAEVFKSGAYDYLPKSSLSTDNLNKCITNALEKWLLTRQLDDYRARLEHLARTDDLTGLANRRYLLETLQQETKRGIRYQHPLSLFIVDVDEFKKINDTYGHITGDKVLIELAEIIRENIRTVDIAGRYGGDEFFIILPETCSADACVIGDRIRNKVQEKAFEIDQDRFHVSVSLGLAEMDFQAKHQDGQEMIDLLITKADKHLLNVKKQGGNCLAY